MEPVNLTDLRSMTDGDAEMEKALFEEFCASFEKSIAVLQASMGAAANETWRKEVHALKGIALNLGALKLGELCKKAQDDYDSAIPAKDDILQHIHAEYEIVKKFLLELSQ